MIGWYFFDLHILVFVRAKFEVNWSILKNLKFSNCSNWLQILHGQRTRYVDDKNTIQSNLTTSIRAGQSMTSSKKSKKSITFIQIKHTAEKNAQISNIVPHYVPHFVPHSVSQSTKLVMCHIFVSQSPKKKSISNSDGTTI